MVLDPLLDRVRRRPLAQRLAGDVLRIGHREEQMNSNISTPSTVAKP